jgi:hypothetical protein
MLIRFTVLFLLYLLARVLFLVFNYRELDQAPLGSLAAAFLAGFRADFMAIALSNAILIALALLRPVAPRLLTDKFLNIVFLLCNLPFLIINVVDLEYYKFIGQRSSFSVFDHGSDIPIQLANLAGYYWHLAIIAGGFIFLASFFLPDGAARSGARDKRRSLSAGRIILAGLVVAAAAEAAQGRLSSKLERGENVALAQLARNSTLSLLASETSCAARGIGGNLSAAAGVEQFQPTRESLRTGRSRLADNVVVIIAESLSTEYTGIATSGRGYAPFLSDLAKQNLSFPNHFANARRSLDALPAILLGLPRLSETTFRCARTRPMEGFASVLGAQGYRTLFFHGGRNGAGDFDAFSKAAGFARYYGMSEYPEPKDFDGVWGIYDEPFLQFAARELARQRQPFAAVLFTVSTHQPYKLPAQYLNRFPQGELPVHKSVGYLDHALQNFFTTAGRMPWFKDTLFIITGDHTGPTTNTPSRFIDRHRVPLILYHPGGTLPRGTSSKVTQHADIGATVLDYLGVSPAPLLSFGRSVFDRYSAGAALGQTGEHYWLASGDLYLERYRDGRVNVSYLADGTPVVPGSSGAQRLLTELEAYIRYYNGIFASTPAG